MTPKHPVGPAFDHAADRAAAWRKIQERALTSDQRKEYDDLKRGQNTALRDHDAKFQETLHDLVNEEKRRLLLHKPEPALRMLPGKPLKEMRAEQLAKANVNARHEAERAGMEHGQQEARDQFLHTVEQARVHAPSPDLSTALRSRAAQRDKARGDEGRERGR